MKKKANRNSSNKIFFGTYDISSVKRVSTNCQVSRCSRATNFTNIEAAIGGKSARERVLEEQFPVSRYTAASKIGSTVISLL